MRTVLLLSFISLNSFAQPTTKATFFNSPAPGTQPTLFAPGIVSDEFGNRDMAISPAGDELLYTMQYLSGRSFSTIMYSRKVNGKWSKPEVASFCGKYNDLEPAFSPDGKKIYFVSNRPLSDTSSATKDYDIWVVEKKNNSWQEAKNMGYPINTGKDEFYPSIAKSSNMYFTRAMGDNDEDIVVCISQGNKYDTAVSLPEAINSKGGEFNAFVDPDEAYIIFTGYKRKGNYGSGDLYVSYRNKQGNWDEAINLGDKVNGAGLTYCPYVSPDKKYFFFTSSRGSFKAPFLKTQSFADLKKLMSGPLNGWDNIYWMESKGILENE